MQSYTKDDLLDALDRVGVSSGDVMLVHSAVHSLGVLAGTDFQQIPDALTKTLLDALGPAGTLIMPAFLYDFPKTGECDLRTAASRVGILTEHFRQREDVLRSCHPMFSFCGVGPSAAELLRPDAAEYHPFKADSVMGRLHDRNAIIVLLGVDIRICTYTVYCEYSHGVPYRFDKPFRGRVISARGDAFAGDFYHFCFPMNGEIREDYSLAQERLLTDGVLKTSVLGMGRVYAFRAAEYHDSLGRYLESDPWFLLPGKPGRFYEYVDGEEKVKEVL